MKNPLIFSSVIAGFGLATASSPPIVDLGYTIHQATVNARIPLNPSKVIY
jgi:hypothetical protein